MLMDETGEILSKSRPEFLLDPVDFIEGSVKLSGERKFGFGVDVMRAWCAFKDSDKDIRVMQSQLEDVNKEVKLLRNLLKSLLGYLHNFDINKS